MSEFEIKDFAQTYYLGIRKDDVLPQELGKAIGEVLPAVFVFLQENKIAPISPPLVLYHCHNVEKGTFDIQGGFFVAEEIAGNEQITCGTIPAGQVVSSVYTGAYENLGERHQATYEWVQQQGKDCQSPCWEVYLNDPADVKPEEYQTQVVYLLK